ncbi:winged helix-turn-helix domain-containing protein [Streptomyces sp. TM32]|uniref:AfsR/SARP family transcriptional regulator n=1 Tax=Streptomyces sp. TM32 TaxID=1652669 RepID=UPI001C20C133|nr:winged helix-turn-helix domain-containing protein [Streptomyces sp. TM32]
MEIVVKVLGPIEARDTEGRPVAVGSLRRRELLGRLVAAGRRAVPLSVLIDDLWEDPPPTAAGTVRTFVAELRRALEPDRPPRTRSHVIETVGTDTPYGSHGRTSTPTVSKTPLRPCATHPAARSPVR